MAFTVAQLTALEESIGSGTLEVQYDGKVVRYQSMDDLIKAYNFVYAKLESQGLISASARTRVSVATFSKD